MALNFETLRDADAGDKHEFGPSISVKFALPDGSSLGASFPVAQTVGFLKVYLERQKGFDYDNQELYLAEKEMMDPLSLVDLGLKSGDKVDVKVVLVNEDAGGSAKLEDEKVEGGGDGEGDGVVYDDEFDDDS